MEVQAGTLGLLPQYTFWIFYREYTPKYAQKVFETLKSNINCFLPAS
jgi:hypothetical protein